MTTYSDLIATAQNLTFMWEYSTDDPDGSSWDPAGYILNSVLHQLSDNNAISNSGTTTVSLNAGDSFGWYVLSKDEYGGRGSIAVNVESTSVPEPSSIVLLATGLLGFAAAYRKTFKSHLFLTVNA